MRFKSEKTKCWLGIFVAVALSFFALNVPAKLITFFIPLSYEKIFYISRISLWIGLLGLFIYARKIEKRRFLLWEERKYSIGFYFLSIPTLLIITFNFLVIFSIIVFLINGTPKQSEYLSKLNSTFNNNYPVIIFTCVTAAVVEELIFRGFIQSRLQVIFKNKVFPIVISSLLFGILHIGYGTLMNILGPICIGLIFALFYEEYRNIKVVMVCHFLWDFTLLILPMYVKLK